MRKFRDYLLHPANLFVTFSLLIVLICALVLLLWAVLANRGASPQQALLGTWHGPCDFPTSSVAFQQVEFLQDGTVLLDSYAGTYSFLDNQRVKLQYGGLGLAFTVAATQNTLTLTDYAGSSCTLQRNSAT